MAWVGIDIVVALWSKPACMFHIQYEIVIIIIPASSKHHVFAGNHRALSACQSDADPCQLSYSRVVIWTPCLLQDSMHASETTTGLQGSGSSKGAR